MRVETIKLREDWNATLTSFIIDPEISFRVYKKRPAIIICPGGAYLTLAKKEGEAVATRFLGLGYHVFVLHYTTYFETRPTEEQPEPTLNKNTEYPIQLMQLMKSMEYVNSIAEDNYIDLENIYVMGFSAGAHLVGSLGVHWDDKHLLTELSISNDAIIRPKGLIMGYPLVKAEVIIGNKRADIGENFVSNFSYMKEGLFGRGEINQDALEKFNLVKNVRPDMPRTFVWQTGEDKIIPVATVTEFVLALNNAKVPCEYHMFEKGGHGMALADEVSSHLDSDINYAASKWVDAVKIWLDLDRKEGIEND